jgi:RNA polymerase sigma-70 factor (ECF subfamily)
MTAKKTNSALPRAWKSSPPAAELPGQFEAIFLEHWPQVFGFLLRLVGDQAEAEDLALETFVRLYQKPPASNPELQIGGWLHRVAANLGLNAIRGWKRRLRYEIESGRDALSEHEEASPAEILIAKEEQQHIRQVLSGMSATQAQILVMRHSDMAYREIAAALGLSAASIGPLLCRAEDEFERRYRATRFEEEEDYHGTSD